MRSADSCSVTRRVWASRKFSFWSGPSASANGPQSLSLPLFIVFFFVFFSTNNGLAVERVQQCKVKGKPSKLESSSHESGISAKLCQSARV
jgi:hypothetical protein